MFVFLSCCLWFMVGFVLVGDFVHRLIVISCAWKANCFLIFVHDAFIAEFEVIGQSLAGQENFLPYLE